jgi:hypothetical protein
MTINGHKFSLGNALTILGMLIAIGASWATLSADNADTKRRVTVVEDRQVEDRNAYKVNQHEIKQDVKEVKSDVQTILRKLEAMEAVQKSERRREQR